MFEIFREPLFWMLMGVCYTLIVISASVWAKDLGLKMNFWKWLFAIFWFLLLTTTIAGGFTLIGENESHAGTYFLGFFGVIDVVLGVALWRVLKIDIKRKEKLD